jgi:DDE superfamily endonuclease
MIVRDLEVLETVKEAKVECGYYYYPSASANALAVGYHIYISTYTNTRAGAKLIYLPPYSPDFNPIENFWSKKNHASFSGSENLSSSSFSNY